MTRDDIIRMAREAGFCDAQQIELNVEWTCVLSELQEFAALVAAAEREECAKVVLDYDQHAIAPAAIAAAIRARGQT